MTLDDGFIKDIASRLRQGEYVLIRPDATNWKAFLFQQERTVIIWGGGFFLAGIIGLIILLFSSYHTSLLVFIGFLLWFVYWRSRVIYRTKHLYGHGLYTYELKPDRIVRYSDTQYDIFSYQELDNIVEERYGLRMEKGVAWYEWLWPQLLKGRNTRLLILPASFPGYQSYLDFLRKKEEEGS